MNNSNKKLTCVQSQDSHVIVVKVQEVHVLTPPPQAHVSELYMSLTSIVRLRTGDLAFF